MASAHCLGDWFPGKPSVANPITTVDESPAATDFDQFLALSTLRRPEGAEPKAFELYRTSFQPRRGFGNGSYSVQAAVFAIHWAATERVLSLGVPVEVVSTTVLDCVALPSSVTWQSPRVLINENVNANIILVVNPSSEEEHVWPNRV